MVLISHLKKLSFGTLHFIKGNSIRLAQNVIFVFILIFLSLAGRLQLIFLDEDLTDMF